MLSRNFKNPIFIISILIFALTTLVLSDIAFARIRLAKVAMQVSTGVVSNFSGTSFDFFPALVKTYADNKNLYVESHGFPDHRLMVGITNWQQQVPIPQDYTGKNAWQIPLKPVISTSPISLKTSLYRGAVALAANGVPVFNALNNR